jgi:hypothetical protein
VRHLLAGAVEDGHAPAGQVDVALGVNGHAVGAELAEEALVGHRAVRLDVVGIGASGNLTI